MSNPTSALQAENIIGDVLAPGTQVPHNLVVKWPSATLERPGQMIERDATQPKPSVFVEPPLQNVNPSDAFTLLMVDPDLTVRHDTRFGQVRHWLVAQATVNTDGEVVVSEAGTISPWVGPAPIPAHHVLGKPHPSRYTFILCRHRDSGSPVRLDPDSLRHQYEGEAGELGNATQDLIDRWKFNTQGFIESNGLEVVAATFMLVEGNLKSAVANAGLTAQAVANKIVGK